MSSSSMHLVRMMTDQQVTDRYTQEHSRLQQVAQWQRKGKQGPRPCPYPNTTVMQCCVQELRRRRLPIPRVVL